MDTTKTYETCPICRQRTRRSDCLVGQSCGCRARLNRIEERNGKILASEDKTRLIVDIFGLVLIRGQRNLQKLQRYYVQVITEKKQKSAELWRKAESKVIAYLRDREERNVSREARHNAGMEILRQSKQEDKEFHHLCRQAIKWEKAAESLRTYLSGIKKKHEEHQEKKKTTVA